MKQWCRLFFVLIVLVFNSCTHATDKEAKELNKETESELSLVHSNRSSGNMSPQEYVQWVQNPDNGLRKKKIIDDLTFYAQYKPYEYIVCMEQQTEQIYDSLLKRKMNELNGMQYYDFKIMLKDGEGELLKYQLSTQEEYNKRVNYFAFAMQNDIQLVEEKDTLPCSLFHFERAYDVIPSCTFLLGFEKKLSNKSKTLIVYDKIFKKGYIKFTFDEKELQNIPTIKVL